MRWVVYYVSLVKQTFLSGIFDCLRPMYLKFNKFCFKYSVFFPIMVLFCIFWNRNLIRIGQSLVRVCFFHIYEQVYYNISGDPHTLQFRQLISFWSTFSIWYFRPITYLVSMFIWFPCFEM